MDGLMQLRHRIEAQLFDHGWSYAVASPGRSATVCLRLNHEKPFKDWQNAAKSPAKQLKQSISAT